MNSKIPQGTSRRVPTEIFADRNHVKSATVIKRLCTTGSYHGIFPIKLANGRWDWPDITAVKNLSNHQDRYCDSNQDNTLQNRPSHHHSGTSGGHK